MTQTFKAGDRFEFGTAQGTVKEVNPSPSFIGPYVNAQFDGAKRRNVFDLDFFEAHATHNPLPNEPGLYVTTSLIGLEHLRVLRLSENVFTSELNWSEDGKDIEDPLEEFKNMLPLRRLIVEGEENK